MSILAATSDSTGWMGSLRNYLLTSTLLAIFSEAAVFHSVVDLKLFYLIMVVNLPILVLYWDYKLPRIYVLLLGYAWISGIVAVALGTNKLTYFLMEAAGITFTSFYFYLFFHQEKRTAVELFETYSNVSFWLCVVGLVLAGLESIAWRTLVPVQSIMNEPAHFCAIVLPAFHYYAATGGLRKGHRLRTLVPLIAILLSVSSLGFVGLVLSASLLLKKRRFSVVLIPVVTAMLFALAYSSLEHFRLRVDDSVQGLTTMDVSSINLSSYAVITSLYVTGNSLHDRPMFGFGLGGFSEAHDRYIGSLSGSDESASMMVSTSKDGSSLLMRVSTELGITGLTLLTVLLVRYRAKPGTIHAVISAGVLIYIVLKLLREGHWFSPEMYFFLGMYALVSRRVQPTAST